MSIQWNYVKKIRELLLPIGFLEHLTDTNGCMSTSDFIKPPHGVPTGQPGMQCYNLTKNYGDITLDKKNFIR